MSRSQAPAIFSPRLPLITVGAQGRLIALAIALVCVWVLITAARLTPNPTGMGTHTQLGLDQCQFALRTGLPCPSCGMTTSFAWLARGNLLASFYVQPMGALLGLLTILTTWACFYIAATGRAVYRLLALGPSRYYIPGLLTWAIIAWGWKIFIHLHGIDGWHP